MSRSWPIDYLDGWRTDITEMDDGKLEIIVQNSHGQAWRAVRDEIEDAIMVALRIVLEQKPNLELILIDPLLDYLDFEQYWEGPPA